ncbi:unnamed protein product, partial [Prorocentrum cordatum]
MGEVFSTGVADTSEGSETDADLSAAARSSSSGACGPSASRSSSASAGRVAGRRCWRTTSRAGILHALGGEPGRRHGRSERP